MADRPTEVDPATVAAIDGEKVWYWTCDDTLCAGIGVFGFSSAQADQHIAWPGLTNTQCRIQWHWGTPSRTWPR